VVRWRLDLSTIGAMPSDSAPSLVLSFAEASSVIREHAAQWAAGRAIAEEVVPLTSAAGRVLAEPVFADRDQPPFDRSTRDGFACRAAELMTQPLRVTGMVRAGEIWADPLEPGAAVEIMTGAPLPSGADCVVMIEHTQRDGSSLRLAGGRRLLHGENVVPAASEAAKGELLLPPGTRIGARHIAIAASCGYATLKVFRKPLVAIQATGDELVEIGETPRPFQIRNSNSYSLAAQVRQSGAEALIQPILRDNCEATQAAIAHAIHDCGADLLILSGGVSMGRFDFVEEALKNLGAEFFFTGAKIQPGKPIVFGRLPQTGSHSPTYFFGLPGNPVSTMVTFTLFVHPLLNALAGETGGAPRFALAHLDGELTLKPGLTRFLPATLETQNLSPSVRPIRWQGSGDLAGNAKANCYVVVPGDLDEGRETMQTGEMVSVLLIG